MAGDDFPAAFLGRFGGYQFTARAETGLTADELPQVGATENRVGGPDQASRCVHQPETAVGGQYGHNLRTPLAVVQAGTHQVRYFFQPPQVMAVQVGRVETSSATKQAAQTAVNRTLAVEDGGGARANAIYVQGGLEEPFVFPVAGEGPQVSQVSAVAVPPGIIEAQGGIARHGNAPVTVYPLLDVDQVTTLIRQFFGIAVFAPVLAAHPQAAHVAEGGDFRHPQAIVQC